MPRSSTLENDTSTMVAGRDHRLPWGKCDEKEGVVEEASSIPGEECTDDRSEEAEANFFLFYYHLHVVPLYFFLISMTTRQPHQLNTTFNTTLEVILFPF